jgi:maltooligosyltrehalose trehalohydrolase
MKRKHVMPFGTELRSSGATRFRLWAPKAESVELRLFPLGLSIPMTAQEGGWFEVETDSLAGAQYRFRIDCEHDVPDPASRFQPEGVHGPSEVVDSYGFDWGDDAWRGRSWEEAVIYELHVGTFSPQGTFAAVEGKLDYLADLGVSAIELMPISSFPGNHNWGYDGVLPYAPSQAYGRPEDLKRLINSAHARNLMVFLDVVYNHFGPEGNYLRLYAPQFFTERHRTPWGEAINFDGDRSRTVRDYFIHNAQYWLEEYHFDGLRLDAVHAIADDSSPDILTELAEAIREKFADRQIHLVLENDNNAARYLERRENRRPRWYTAQWNDDIHHAAHVLLTRESYGYYSEYREDPADKLGRCLTEGFAYQGAPSPFRNGAPRGEPSRHLAPECFISFLQNHDQVGNRACGERLACLSSAAALRAMVAVLLLAPSPPLLFMGEEFGATTPFLFFCDFSRDLAEKVRHGRRQEFRNFAQFHTPDGQSRIPDPNDRATFLESKLDWNCLDRGARAEWLRTYRTLLSVRQRKIVPVLRDIVPGAARYHTLGPSGVFASWEFARGGTLELFANFGRDPVLGPGKPQGHLIYATSREAELYDVHVPASSAAWFLNHDRL